MENPENTPLLPEEPETPFDKVIIPEDSIETEAEIESEAPEPVSTDEDVEPASADDNAEPAFPAEEEISVPKEESRVRLFFRRLIRWTAGLLIVFGLGFITALFAIYYPKVNQLDQAQSSLVSANDEIADLEEQINTLQGQIESLTTQTADLETRNQDLLAEQDALDLQFATLTARVDVASAQVALYAENPAQARIHLENTSDTLASIADLLPADQKDVVKPMQSRLELALGEIDSDPETAIADLVILAGNLLEMETSLLGE